MSDSDYTPTDPNQSVADGPPSPEVSAPSPASVAPPSPMPDLGAPSTATPTLAPQPGHLWRDVLAGALSGLAGSAGAKNFGGGLAMGAAGQQRAQQQATENQQAQAAQSSAIKFQSAQAAHLTAQAAAEDMRLHALPEQLQSEQTARAQEEIARWQALGIEPTLVADNHADGATAGLQQLTDRDGAVGNNHYVNVGTHVYAFDLSQVGDSPQALSLINKDADVTGRQPINLQTYQQMSKPEQAQLLNSAMGRFTQTPGTPQEAQSQLAQWTNYQNTYAAKTDGDPATQAKIDAKVDTLKKISASFDAHDVSLAAAKSGAEAQAKAGVETAASKRAGGLPVVAYDPEQDANIVMSAQDAKDQGLFGYKADPAKINSTIAGFNDVQVKVNRLADVVNRPDFSTVQGPLAAALLDSKGIAVGFSGVHVPFERINTGLYAENLAKANQATRDYVVATVAAHEALTQLPRLQTFGQSSRVTEAQMEASQKMLPSPGDDQKMGSQKMDSLQETLDPLRKQLPRMPGANLIPSFKDRQAAKQ